VSNIGMATIHAHPVHTCAHTSLERLRRQVSHTVSIAVLQGEEIVYLDRLPGFRGHAKLKLNIGISSRLPAYCTSIGKVLLAHLPPDDRRAALQALTLGRRTANTHPERHAGERA
jgi:IclR family pca regulon transcriptional regulator